MKFLKWIKANHIEILFVTLVVLCFYIYFVIYLTPSRAAWYQEMTNQANIVLQKLFQVLH